MRTDRLSYFFSAGVALFSSGIFLSIEVGNLIPLILNSFAGIMTCSYAIFMEVNK